MKNIRWRQFLSAGSLLALLTLLVYQGSATQAGEESRPSSPSTASTPNPATSSWRVGMVRAGGSGERGAASPVKAGPAPQLSLPQARNHGQKVSAAAIAGDADVVAAAAAPNAPADQAEHLLKLDSALQAAVAQGSDLGAARHHSALVLGGGP